MTGLASVTSVSAARQVTFDRAARALPLVTLASATAAIALVTFKTWRGSPFPYFTVVTQWSAAAVAASLIVSFILRRVAVKPAARIESATSWLMSIEVGIALLAVPVFLLAKGTPADEITGWVWPLVNKRWLLALYNIAIATFLIFPVAAERWRSSRAPELFAGAPPVHDRREQGRTVLGALVIVALCWYVAGPPWHLEQHHRSIEWHEQVHFGALQAISKGYLPYIGPAATAYGPGSLGLMSATMRFAGSFNLLAFRTAWLAQHFLAVLAIGLVGWWWLGTVPAVAVMVLALAYSPLRFYYTLDDGTLTGFFGWANALRYCAPLIVVPALAAAATKPSRTPAALLLGILWGTGAWLAQDGLTTTATAVVLLLVLLVLTQTVALRVAIRLVRDLSIGFACVAAAVLGYYAAHRSAGQFLDVYFAFPRAITVGLGDAWWPAAEARQAARISYYLTLPFLLACATCALWRFPAMQLVRPLDSRRIRFLAFVCVQIVCYQSVLLWSDSSHLMSTMIALPFLVVLAVTDLPQWLAPRARGRLAVRIGCVAVAIAAYPSLLQVCEAGSLLRPARRFLTKPAAYGTPGIGWDPVRPLRAEETLFIGGNTMTVAEFQAFASSLHTLVGNRKTYCARVDWIAGGLIAFLADLTPAPHPPGGDLLTFNDDVRQKIADHMRAHPRDYEAFIGPLPDGIEARGFLDSHPGAVALERRLGDLPVHILLSPP